MKKSSYKFVALIIIIISAIVAVKFLGLTAYLDEKVLREWIEGFGIFGPIIYMLIYAIAPSLMLPGLALTVVGGILFGPIWGLVYVISGATVGACLAFLIARYLGRDFIEARLLKSGQGRWSQLDKKVELNGWKVVAVTRLIPLFPFNLLNYAFGLTKIKFLTYLWATFIFMLPGAAAYVIFSSSFLGVLKGRISKEFIIGVLLVVSVSLLPTIYKRLKNKERPL